MKESILYYCVKTFAWLIRLLPVSIALWVGRCIGLFAYYFDVKHKSQAYANLKIAFADVKSSQELKQITKTLFTNYGQNLIELFRMPLLDRSKFDEFVKMEGQEHIQEALKKGKGVILIAMHFGSWEMASLTFSMLGHPYKVIVKPQKKYSKLDELLNSYRDCGGSVVLSRGMGTRDFVKSLKNNEIIGMVVDQGGKDGVLVPFFGRQASMSVGAIRMGLKSDIPLCFSVIFREKGSQHRMVFQKPLELSKSGDVDKDVVTNLTRVTKIMEDYIEKYPSEYMWFYKIWKYSKQATVAILTDGKAGHLRQSQLVGQMVQKALEGRGISSKIEIIEIQFKTKFLSRLFSLMAFFSHPFLYQGRLQFLKLFLSAKSFEQVMSMKTDFIISCGSSSASLNHFISQDHSAKSIAILKPGILPFNRFDLIVLPEHDISNKDHIPENVTVIKGACNLISKDYLDEQSEKLLAKYSHLKSRTRTKVGILIGGTSKKICITEKQISVLINQLKEISGEHRLDFLISTSRRTPANIERMLFKAFKKDPSCPLLVLANQENVPEAVGGILGLSDILVVSGDSISMVSEAASSGKNTIVFSPEPSVPFGSGSKKHQLFINNLNSHGFICSSKVTNVGQNIYNVIKNKIHTQRLDGGQIILDAVRRVI